MTTRRFDPASLRPYQRGYVRICNDKSGENEKQGGNRNDSSLLILSDERFLLDKQGAIMQKEPSS
jgi:hypothetical protein